jgi:hypothetical protein
MVVRSLVCNKLGLTQGLWILVIEEELPSKIVAMLASALLCSMFSVCRFKFAKGGSFLNS